MNQLCYIFVICTVCCGIVLAGEMTFELPDSVKQCFHEHIEKGVKCTLEYQVSNIGLHGNITHSAVTYTFQLDYIYIYDSVI